MARVSSIILTKEDKKAKIAELRQSIKEVKVTIKGVGTAVKENDKTLAAAVKEHASVLKALTKEGDNYAKHHATLEAQLSALTNATSVGTAPVAADKPKRPRRTKAEMEAARAAGTA